MNWLEHELMQDERQLFRDVAATREAEIARLREELGALKAGNEESVALVAGLYPMVCGEGVRHEAPQYQRRCVYCVIDALRMPDELVGRVRCAVEDGFDDQGAHSILSDILAWHESLKEGKDE